MNGKSVLTGGLKFISLADVFQTLGKNDSTGVLEIKNKYITEPGLVYFVNGNPVDASSGSLKGTEAIYSLFGWTEGDFEFFEKDIQVDRTVSDSIMQIILDATRLVDEGKIDKLGPSPRNGITAEVNGRSGYGDTDAIPVVRGSQAYCSDIINEEQYLDGQYIIKEGDHGNWIWIIIEGRVKVTKLTTNGTLTISRLGEGCFIGNFTSLLYNEHARTATVSAEGNVRLGMLNTQRLFAEYSGLSSDFRGLLQSLSGRMKKITDVAVEIASADCVPEDLIRKNKPIYKSVLPRRQMFSIKEGEIYVMRATKKRYLPLYTLENGDVCGYVPFANIGHEPYSASIFASQDIKVTKLDMAKLENEHNQLSSTIKNLIENVSACISFTTSLVCRLQDGKQFR